MSTLTPRWIFPAVIAMLTIGQAIAVDPAPLRKPLRIHRGDPTDKVGLDESDTNAADASDSFMTIYLPRTPQIDQSRKQKPQQAQQNSQPSRQSVAPVSFHQPSGPYQQGPYQQGPYQQGTVWTEPSIDGPTCGCDAGIAPNCGCESIEPWSDAGCDGIGCTSSSCDSQRCQLRRRQAFGGRFSEPRNFTVHAEYLLWWVDGFEIPPLLTTSATGTALSDAGVLGLPSTRVLVGNETLLEDSRSGGRLRLNYWLDPQQYRGIEAIYTGLENQRYRFAANSTQYPILARPFFNVENNVAGQDAELVAFPNELTGNALVTADSQLDGVEILYRHALRRDCGIRLDGLIGWRHNRLDESVHFSDFKSITGNGLGLPVGTTLSESDHFETENRFHGGELGVLFGLCRCNCTIEGIAKVALGNNRSRTRISGQAVFTEPGGQPAVTRTPAGLLAQSTNIGVHEEDDFAVIPEFGVTLGRHVTRHWRATLGYSFMYWSRVARPGDQIDTQLNLTQLDPTGLQGIARPQRTNAVTDLWAQGLRFGLEGQF